MHSSMAVSPSAAATKPVRRLHPARKRACAVIPARDEADDVGDVVRRVLEAGIPAIVIDDCSNDRTAEIARAAGAMVLRLPFHGGSWAAIQTGMRQALALGFGYVITLDADGQHHPEDIPALLERMDAPDAPDVIIASCPDRANQRRKLAWRVLRALSGLNIDDLTSGYRVYAREAVQLLASQDCTLLEYQDVGVLLHLVRNRFEIVEDHVRMRPRRHGRSRVFSSWAMVGYYLVYSCLIGGSRRVRRTRR
ncbi:MAG: glycosyltransferase family 2 protein [Wenzhouxiangellaceae bacterium]|nr:glycosyltransferase family 2 protein [Wenzhouxiangellaceae bacterium]